MIRDLDAVLDRPHQRLTCTVGYNESHPEGVDLYGGQSARLSGRLGRAQIRPLIDYFGFGPQAGGPKDLRQQERLAGGTGPLAEFIRQARDFLPGMYGQSQAIGKEVAGQGRQAYNTFQGELGGALDDLGVYGAGGRRAHELAGRYAERAASPLADEDLYQVAQRRVLAELRPSLAARGLEGSSGAGAQAESDAVRNLALDYTDRRRADQYNSLAAYEQAGQSGAGLSAMRPQLAAGGMEAVGQFAQMLEAEYGIPMQAFGSILQMLMGGTQPALGLAQITGPQVSTASSGVRVI